jgi:hypothetical protein
VARPPNSLGRSQMRQKFLLKYAPRLDKKASVDRLVRNAFVLIIWMFTHLPACTTSGYESDPRLRHLKARHDSL